MAAFGKVNFTRTTFTTLTTLTTLHYSNNQADSVLCCRHPLASTHVKIHYLHP